MKLRKRLDVRKGLCHLAYLCLFVPTTIFIMLFFATGIIPVTVTLVASSSGVNLNSEPVVILLMAGFPGLFLTGFYMLCVFYMIQHLRRFCRSFAYKMYERGTAEGEQKAQKEKKTRLFGKKARESDSTK